MRDALGWNQHVLASKLNVSQKTLSNWENGYWLPPLTQRVHVVLSLHAGPPEHVLDIAAGLGVSEHPVVAALLAPLREALEGPPSTPTVPAPPRAPPAGLRAVVDAAILAGADALNARPNDVRAAVASVLAACAKLDATLADAEQVVTVRYHAK
jgi:hypothetical protein